MYTHDLPERFVARMVGLLGGEATAFLDSLAEPAVSGLRANTLKVSPALLAGRLPWPLEPLPWCPAGYLLPADAPAGRHPYHAAGLYYLQEPSAMLPAELLAPQPGEWVLDLCAAPGGKATHLAALMGDQGVLVANEIVPGRARTLAENLERWGTRHTLVLNETPARLAERWPAAFDRVLVDAPCSGEGMFRKSAEARRDWSPEQVAGCALRQGEILAAAAGLLRPGGWLCYSTCTFAPEENEGVLVAFLAAHPDFEAAEVRRLPGVDRGRPEWVGAAGEVAAQVARAVRLWPHRAPGEGHFAALLRRAGYVCRDDPSVPLRAGSSRPPTANVARAWKAFCQAALTADPTAGLLQAGDWLFAPPPEMPDTAGRRVLRPGWRLGRVQKGRLEPSHALALGLAAADAQRTLDLSADSPEVTAYLRGETLHANLPDGWALVTADGFALGWARVVRGVAKNHYPKALRRF